MIDYAHRNYTEKLDMMNDDAFRTMCEEQDIDPEVYLGIKFATRADKCIRPIVPNVEARINEKTGETTDLVLPCGSNSMDVCPYCAEQNQRQRNRQILNTLENGRVYTALLTMTAPSFGRVHRNYWTAKDVFKHRALNGKQLEAKRLLKARDPRSACPCGGLHTFDEGIAGAPIFKKQKAASNLLEPFQYEEASGYDYAGETIWSHNLPALMNSLYKKLKRMGLEAGIDKEALHLYAVYERQARGSLHAHVLIAVDKNMLGFRSLVRAIDSVEWTPPTARIPSDLVEHYGSELVQARITEADVKLSHFPAEAIPHALWKGQRAPATSFGSIRDIRVLEPDQAAEVELSAEINTYKQASSYLSKYLTKSQSSYSPTGIKKLKGDLRKHAESQRRTAFAMLADFVVYEVQRKALEKHRDLVLRTDIVEELRGTHGQSRASETLNVILRGIILHRQKGVTRSALIDMLLHPETDAFKSIEGSFLTHPMLKAALAQLAISAEELILDASYDAPRYTPGGVTPITPVDAARLHGNPDLAGWVLRFVALKQDRPFRSPEALEASALDVMSRFADAAALMSFRSLKIRLNKLGNNGGFTGSLTRVSNWGSLKALREQQKAYAVAHGGDADSWEWVFLGGLDTQRMEQLRAERAPDRKHVEYETHGPIWDTWGGFITGAHTIKTQKRTTSTYS